MARFSFNGIFDDKMYETAQVMVVTGPYSIFSNIVCDRLRDMCRGVIELDSGVNEVFEEFGLEELSETDKSNAIQFDMFLEVARTPPLSGKWYCRVDWKELTKKQQSRLESYIKKPSEYGCLVVTSAEYGDYSRFLKSRALSGSLVAHIIQLSFPSRSGLARVIEMELAKHGARADKDAIQTFILRMSNAYEEYQDRLADIASSYGHHTISRADMAEALQGVENYVLDDFMRQLTVPVNSTKLVTNRKIVRMLRVMVDEYGAVDLVKKLRFKVNDAILMRMAINSGIVPVRIRYSVDEAKKKLDEGNKLKSMNDYSFRKLAQLASLTSLRDWLFMRLILSTPRAAYGDAEYERALYALINRTAFGENRIYNIIGVLDNLEIQPELYHLVVSQQETKKGEPGKAPGAKKKSSTKTDKPKAKKVAEAGQGMSGQQLWERDKEKLLEAIQQLGGT